jgi:hypothetical protein
VVTGKSKPRVSRWQKRFMAEGADGLLRGKIRPAGIESLDQSVVDQIAKLTLEPQEQKVTHWTVRKMAKAVGVAASSIVKIWHTQVNTAKAEKRRLTSVADLQTAINSFIKKHNKVSAPLRVESGSRRSHRR